MIEGFVVDFYCHDQKLAIELDGRIHNKKTRKEYDELRQAEIESKSIKIIRIRNEEFEKDENILFGRIESALKYKQYHITPSPFGRGGAEVSLVGGEGRSQIPN